MQKITILLLSVLISNAAWADLSSLIDSFNKLVKQAGTSPDCETCEVAVAGKDFQKNAPEEMKKCVESLCTNPKYSLWDTTHRVHQAAAGPLSPYDKAVAPLIAAHELAESKSELEKNHELGKWAQNAKPLTDPGEIRLFNLFSALRNVGRFKTIRASAGNEIIDVKASRSRFPEMSNAEYRRTAKVASKILQSADSKPFPTIEPSRLSLFFPGEELPRRIAQVVQEIAAKSRAIEADPALSTILQLPGIKASLSLSSLYRKFQTKELNSEELADLNQTAAFVSLLHSTMNDRQLIKDLSEGPAPDIVALAQKPEVKSYLEQRKAQLESEIADPKPRDSTACRIAYASAQEYLPTEIEIEKFRKKVEEVKAAFTQQVKGLQCQTLSREFESVVASWEASLPQSKEKFEQSFRRTLEEEMKESQVQRSADLQELRNPGKSNRLGAFMIAFQDKVSKPKNASSRKTRIDDACEKLKPDLVPDATASGSPNFVVGPFSMKHPEAVGIIHHELAHKLYGLMKTGSTCQPEWFQKVRKCLAENHSELSFSQFTADQKKAVYHRQTTYDSEDFADLISAQVDPKNNMACAFVRNPDEGEYAKLSLKNPNASDPHSSHLFRMLHVDFLKNGKLTEQCNRALAARGEKATFKNCFLPLK